MKPVISKGGDASLPPIPNKLTGFPELAGPLFFQRAQEGKDQGFDAAEEWERRGQLFDDLREDKAFFQELADGLCQILSLRGPARAFDSGTAAVFWLPDQQVLKIYNPLYPHDLKREAAILEVLSQSGQPCPRVIHKGRHQGWPILLMSHLPGQSGLKLWPTLSPTEKASLMTNIGAITARMHALGVHDSWSAFDVDWPAFIDFQVDGCLKRQRQLGWDSRWLQGLPAFLEAQRERLGQSFKQAERVLLHTEIMPGALLIEGQGPTLAVSGLYDFGDSMTGDRRYDFGSVAVFLSGGQAELWHAFLRGYGLTKWSLEDARQGLFYLLCHVYCHMPWYFRLNPLKPSVTSFDDLARAWFPVMPD